ncbi:MAG: bifunctional 5,10-methylenetetrahydrofolate dehydrogenase/5,10-methenyltetrahydrofolate cyclohydrolase [Rhodobiaceae bacterium]|nr:bifunctional 5,10-methylenetetrahydrofolate dehydrogenase/5,10-methenyltetrahydrofolate cyclohydrolase [Rhodobiaceae bacterium]
MTLTATDHLLDGRAVAADMLARVRGEAASLAARGDPARLVSVSIGASEAVTIYVRNQRRSAERVGIAFIERQFAANVPREDVLRGLRDLNEDPEFTGIIIQRPVPPHLSIRELQGAVDPGKDVEGMHPASIGNIVYNDLALAPCTASAAVELLRRTGRPLVGLETVVIGHSEIVGKPIAFLLMAEGATVTVCHHMTRDLALHSRRADAVFVAVGRPGLITGDMLKPGTVLIDIGINRVAGPGGSRIVGDADFESCAAVAGRITPVPGGVGPVTVAILMQNAVTAARRLRTAAPAVPA